MDIKKLMVGSQVSHKEHGGIWNVFGVDEYGLDCYLDSKESRLLSVASTWCPIPLYESMLKELGFNKKRQFISKGFPKIGKINYYIKNDVEIYIEKWDNEDEWTCVYINNNTHYFLRNLHNLQSIYKSLKGENLIYKKK